MSLQFIPSKGCVYVPFRKEGQGWYKLAGLNAGSAESPILIVGAQLTDSDIVLPITALGDIQIVMVFGRQIGDVQVMGNVLCGEDASSGQSFAAVVSFFNAHRVSKSLTPVSLSLPGGQNYNIFINGLGLAQPDGQYNIQPFIIYGMIASPPGGE